MYWYTTTVSRTSVEVLGATVGICNAGYVVGG